MPSNKRLSVLLVIAVFAAVAIFVRSNYTVPVLMYHRINPQTSRQDGLIVSPDTLERQVRFLKNHNYNIVTLDVIADLLKNNKRIPPKTIALTFDDGYADNYTNAFPILKKYGVPATFFIIVDEVGRPQGDRMSWEELRRMRDAGVAVIGSHALGPEPLVNIGSQEELRRQVFDSKKALEEKLGAPVYAFSYPEGLFNESIRKTVIDAGYMVAAATRPGKDYPNDDIFALKRLRISEEDRNMLFFRVQASGYYMWIKEIKKKRR